MNQFVITLVAFKIKQVKYTKRKGFNFFRSYYDVYNELSNKDKVAFIDALLDRQFLGIKPNDLKGLAKFAYISQTNSIDSQVKGYEDKTKTRLDGSDYKLHPTVGGKQGGIDTPTVQEKEKEKEKEQGVYGKHEFFQDWNELRSKHLKKPSHLNFMSFTDLESLKELSKDSSREDIKKAMVGLFKQKNLPNGNTNMQSNPTHFFKCFNSYLTAFYDANDKLYGKKED